jgi:hypothetical protein
MTQLLSTFLYYIIKLVFLEGPLGGLEFIACTELHRRALRGAAPGPWGQGPPTHAKQPVHRNAEPVQRNAEPWEAWEAWEAQGQRNAEHPNQLEPALSLLEKQQLFKWYLLLAQFFNKDTVF